MTLTSHTVRCSAALALLAAILAGGAFLVFGRSGHADAPERSASGKWTCSMCPQFILPEPGKCPKCFMDLIPLVEGALDGGRLELILSPDAARAAGIRTTVVETVFGSDHGVLGVPMTAVLENFGRHFVFSEMDGGDTVSYAMREIETVGRRGGTVLVASGLDEGEAVVSAGAFRIDSALQMLGKISLVNLPAFPLDQVDEIAAEPFMPADRSGVDPRRSGVALDEWFGGYERLRAVLAKDDVGGAVASARALADIVSAAGPAVDGDFDALRGDFSRSVGMLAEAGSLDGIRDSFDKVSAGMVLMARRYGAPAGGLNLVFCPMAFGGTGAHWLQPQETVDNPYHGLEMPTCGWQVEVIPE